ncbi:MAG: hypothetical protein ACK4YQ_09745 [Phenylobacterium sp.]|uniref:hypothetical protein n=1 Tax=Phenylobacterium sp. TaxID=1871053 RepID=UPI00391D4E6C
MARHEADTGYGVGGRAGGGAAARGVLWVMLLLATAFWFWAAAFIDYGILAGVY